MQADFLDAFERHWTDAELLLQAERFANADHLYGMAAECGLKRLMRAFGMPYDTARGRPQEPEDRVHADRIWARYEAYRYGHHHGAVYVLSATDPFGDWDVAQRYAHRSNFNVARAQAHRGGANVVRDLVQQAKREGLI